MSDKLLTRRRLLGSVGAVVTGSAFAQGQQGAKRALSAEKPVTAEKPKATIDSGPRVAPVDEVALVREFEDSARLTLPGAVFSTTSGTDRRAFDRITARQRMIIPTIDMDLSVELFGDSLFTPIVVGPVPDQKRYHADAELGTVRGASAGKAAVVVSSRSSVPIEQVAAEAKTPLWYQVSADAEAKAQIQRAVHAGVRAVIVSVGTLAGAAEPDWAKVDGLRRGVSVPLVVKGITTPAEAKLALQHGAQGIVVSSWGRASNTAPILALASIVDAVGGKVPVLIDGSFRLGVDVYKALAFGAQGVLIARPAMWALSAYGAGGVQKMVELLQTELAQTMSGCGNPTIKSITRNFVKVHATAFP